MKSTSIQKIPTSAGNNGVTFPDDVRSVLLDAEEDLTRSWFKLLEEGGLDLMRIEEWKYLQKEVEQIIAKELETSSDEFKNFANCLPSSLQAVLVVKKLSMQRSLARQTVTHMKNALKKIAKCKDLEEAKRIAEAELE